MRGSWLLGLAAGAVMATAVTASAHTACCEAKGCPTGQTAVPGATPADAQCCTDPATPSTCTSAPNAGWSCVIDPQDIAMEIPGRQAIAGCVQVDQPPVPDFGECVGGAITQGGPEGCIGFGVAFLAGANPNGTAEDCTNAAVDACCAADACYVAPPE